MTAAEAPRDGIVEVQLREFPIALHVRAEEHHEELLREFAHIAHSDPQSSGRIPERLVALVQRLRAQYAPVTGAPRARIEEARTAGRKEIDLTYFVPSGVIDAARQLVEELEEADEFCRSGELLTLSTPAELAQFRRWFLGEFQRQSSGQPATPWPEYSEP